MPDDDIPFLRKLRAHIVRAADRAPRRTRRRSIGRVVVGVASIAAVVAASTLLFRAFRGGVRTGAVLPTVTAPATTPPAISPSISGLSPTSPAVSPTPSIGPSGIFPSSGPAPLPIGDGLNDVVALSNDDAWAVGVRFSAPEGAPFGALVEHWDGTAWTRVGLPDVGPLDDVGALQRVAASGPTDVWAINSARVIHFDGSAWSVIPTPDVTRGARFPGYQWSDVVAIAPDDAWLVGTQNGEGYAAWCDETRPEVLPLIEHWDGEAWHVVDSPRLPVHKTYLAAATAVGPSDVWALGEYYTDVPSTQAGNGCANHPQPHARTLAIHWDGASWTIVPTPDPGVDNYVGGVDATASGYVWAVGQSTPSEGFDRPFFLRWNGTDWVNAPVSDPAAEKERSPGGVVAIGPDDAWTAGEYPNVPSIHRWDGSSWTVQEEAAIGLDPGGDHGAFGGIDASSSSDVWAVGSAAAQQAVDGRSASEALILHWDGRSWSRIPAAPYPG